MAKILFTNQSAYSEGTSKFCIPFPSHQMHPLFWKAFAFRSHATSKIHLLDLRVLFLSIFSGQKGATPDIQERLEKGMIHLSSLYKDLTGIEIANLESAGAAGGFAGGLVAVASASIISGIQVIFDSLKLKEKITESDLLITGEGCFDQQTKQGKVVDYVDKCAKQLEKPIVVICGMKKDISPDDETIVFDLVSLFDPVTSMTKPTECLRELLKRKARLFPVLKELS